MMDEVVSLVNRPGILVLDARPRVFYDHLFPNLMFLVMDTPTTSDYWQDVILADLTTPDSPRVTFAEEGRLLVDRDQRTVSFYLKDAELHQVSQQEPDDYQRQNDHCGKDGAFNAHLSEFLHRRLTPRS